MISDHSVPSCCYFYFLDHRTFPRGIRNQNGFQEILSTSSDSEGSYYGNNSLALCIDEIQIKSEITPFENIFTLNTKVSHRNAVFAFWNSCCGLLKKLLQKKKVCKQKLHLFE